MKYSPQFKTEVISDIGVLGLKNTIKKYCMDGPIRPEIIRIWADPNKQRIWREKSLALYNSKKHDETFLAIRRNRTYRRTHNEGETSLVYSYSLKQMQDQFKTIISSTGKFNAEPNHNRIILTYQPHYYETENILYKDENVKEQLLANREKYLFKSRDKLNDKEILRGFKISGIHVGFSHFSPLWIKAFIEKYGVKSIYDPCGGWGHRLLGSTNIKYIYNDLDTRTYNGVKSIAKDFNIHNTVFYNQDAATLKPIDAYDAVFTCPPYFNTEIYNNNPFKDFVSYIQWWDQVVKCATISTLKYFVVVINNEFKSDIIQVSKNNKLELIEEISVGRNRLNHFQRVAVSQRKGEYMLIFQPLWATDNLIKSNK